MLSAALLVALQGEQELKVVRVDRDDMVITESCSLQPSGEPILDDEGDGVVQIVGDGLTVVFANTPLSGSAVGATPDTFSGIGVRVRGKNVTVRGAILRGFKGAIWATQADGLVVEGCDVSHNFRQRLRSTPKAEDGGDWLWPHKNDQNEWLTNYGAGIYVEESKAVTLRQNLARHTQNGICLRRVDESQIYDNDMSWLSGWGLAMYRSSRNVVSNNSFDFCIRGYSHGVYARGQDSAGILFFEQCSDNVFAYNSATHGGDGFFGFAGLEALEGGLQQAGLGCNRNLLWRNDFSYAAAIGIELTFSYDNVYAGNRLNGSNYGVWGGYSGRTRVVGNEIEENTLAGIAIEHGSQWEFAGNKFRENARAIELWWDDDKDLLAKPWAKLNPTVSRDYFVRQNRFVDDAVQLELRGGTTGVVWTADNAGTDRSRWRGDDLASVEERGEAPTWTASIPNAGVEAPKVPGQRVAVGLRKQLSGRDKIVITEWGPYDWESPYLQRVDDRDGAHVWRLLGNDVPIGIDAGPDVVVKLDAGVDPPSILLTPRRGGEALPYELKVRVPSQTLSAKDLLLSTRWRVTVGGYTSDPREDAQAWREQVARGVSFESGSLALRYNGGGPSDLANAPQALKDAQLGRERFGTLASTRVKLGAGRWRLSTNSDDGVRVKVDGLVRIENWTHHGPTVDTAELAFDTAAEHTLEVEHFELDGWAVLELTLEPLP